MSQDLGLGKVNGEQTTQHERERERGTRGLTRSVIPSNTFPKTPNKRKKKLAVEDGITEWQSPELVGGENPYKPPSLIDLLENFPEINPKWEPMCRPEPFETEEEMCTRAARVARILADSCFPSDVLIVSHAPCNIAIGLGLEGLDLKEARGRTKIEPWPLGGLTRFTRDSVGESSRWELAESCATGHLSGQWREGKQRWTLPALRRHVQARGW